MEKSTKVFLLLSKFEITQRKIGIENAVYESNKTIGVEATKRLLLAFTESLKIMNNFI